MRVSIVGLGLIGGSVARSLRHAAGWSVAAWSPSGEGPRRALAEGVVASAPASLEEAIEDADLIVLAAPPLACLDLIGMLGGPLRGLIPPRATVTDVASTKGTIVARAEAEGLRFVGGHPMAGREKTGYDAAAADLFAARPWVVVPAATARRTDVRHVEALAVACGARPLRMEAVAHDRAVAAVSHLPLVLGVALVEAVAGLPDEPAWSDWEASSRLAAGGWRDITRVAHGDAEMGAGIAVTNAEALAARIRDVQAVLDGWLSDLVPEESAGLPDPVPLRARFRSARERLGEP